MQRADGTQSLGKHAAAKRYIICSLMLLLSAVGILFTQSTQ